MAIAPPHIAHAGLDATHWRRFHNRMATVSRMIARVSMQMPRPDSRIEASSVYPKLPAKCALTIRRIAANASAAATKVIAGRFHALVHPPRENRQRPVDRAGTTGEAQNAEISEVGFGMRTKDLAAEVALNCPGAIGERLLVRLMRPPVWLLGSGQ